MAVLKSFQIPTKCNSTRHKSASHISSSQYKLQLCHFQFETGIEKAEAQLHIFMDKPSENRSKDCLEREKRSNCMGAFPSRAFASCMVYAMAQMVR